jgi:hypothetical protein
MQTVDRAFIHSLGRPLPAPFIIGIALDEDRNDLRRL